MKRKLLVAAIAATMLAPVVAQAADVTVGGRVRVNIEKTDVDTKDDLDINENKARIRMQASETTAGGMKIIAQNEIEFADDALVAKSQRILLVDDWGTLVLAGVSPSGQFADLYGHSDIFQSTGPLGYDQGDQTGKLVAYANKFGAVKFVAAAFMWGANGALPDVGADENFDVLAVRAIWSDGPLSIGAGYASIVEDGAVDDVLNGAQTGGRMAFMASYDMEAMMAGITVEQTSKDATDADHTTIAVSLKAPLSDGWLVSGAVYSVSADDNSVTQADGAQRVILNIQNAMAPGVTWYANYTMDNEDAGDDAELNTGVNFSF